VRTKPRQKALTFLGGKVPEKSFFHRKGKSRRNYVIASEVMRMGNDQARLEQVVEVLTALADEERECAQKGQAAFEDIVQWQAAMSSVLFGTHPGEFLQWVITQTYAPQMVRMLAIAMYRLGAKNAEAELVKLNRMIE
jgi:hypothetical protein